jgi:hypothetical protein
LSRCAPERASVAVWPAPSTDSSISLSVLVAQMIRCRGAAQLWRHGGLHGTVRAFSRSRMVFSDKSGPGPGVDAIYQQHYNASMALELASTDEERAKAMAELTRCREKAKAQSNAFNDAKTTLFATNMASHPLCAQHVHVLNAGHLESRIIFAGEDAKEKWMRRDSIRKGVLVQVADALAQNHRFAYGRCLVVHGMSGLGKTFGSMLLAATPRTSDEPVEAAVVYLRRVDLDITEADVTGVRDDRDDNARNAVTNAIAKLMNNMQLVADDARKSTVYVVIDEVGSSPNFIRGAISVVNSISKRVANMTGAKEARLVLVGTGAAGATLEPGSLPENYSVWRPSANLTWKYLQDKEKDEEIKRIMQNVDKRETIETATAHDVVSTNARAATAFVRFLKELLDVVKSMDAPNRIAIEPKIVGLAAQLAAFFYKLQNGLEKLTTTQLITAVSMAVAACHVNSTLKSDLHNHLVCKLGILQDSARRDHVGSGQAATVKLYHLKEEDANIVVPPESYGQRYTLSPSLVTIAELFTNTGSRHWSGEGFERVVADWFVWAIHSSVYINHLRDGTKSSSAPVRSLK